MACGAGVSAASQAPTSTRSDQVSPGRAPDAGRASLVDCPQVCPEMVPLTAGWFHRGAPYVDADPPPPYTPPETVIIDRPFAIGRYPVTVGEYGAFVRDTGRTDVGLCQTRRGTVGRYRLDPAGSWRDPGFEQTDRHPVVCVSVADAKAYAAWLSKKTGRVYRLPTVNEWEYAARGGGNQLKFYTGERPEDVCRYANVQDRRWVGDRAHNTTEPCDDGYAYTSPVGAFPPNGFGLYDIIGNVSEWTATPAAHGSGLQQIAGGSWSSRTADATLSSHAVSEADMRRNQIGFRVVREL
jgi:formylglycine-generating enzyme required for sulfatase activity